MPYADRIPALENVKETEIFMKKFLILKLLKRTFLIIFNKIK